MRSTATAESVHQTTLLFRDGPPRAQPVDQMSIRTNSVYMERERNGEEELHLVAVTYTGNRSMYSPQNAKTQGGWPSHDSFHNSEPKLAFIPSRALGWWEQHGSFDIEYEPAEMAKVLLEKNYIPDQIVGPGYNPEVREKFIEDMGIEACASEEEYREELRELAGIEEDEVEDDEGVDEPTRRKDRLTNSVDRSVLVKVANSYDEIDGFLDEHEKSSVSHLSQTLLAEFLLEQEEDAVDRRIDRAEAGQDI